MNASPSGIASCWDPHFVNYALIPVLIFLARICDVSLGTIRIISAEEVKSIHSPPFAGSRTREAGAFLRLFSGRRRFSRMAP